MPSTPGGGPPRQQSLDTILRDLQKRMTALESVTGGQTVGTPSSNLGGDLGGTLAAANVVGIQSRPVGAQAPSSEQGLVWNGSDWIPESIVNSFEGRTGDVALAKADVTGTGLAPADIGALRTGNACQAYLNNGGVNWTWVANSGGVYRKIPLDTVDAGHDPLGQWDATNQRFVAAEAGLYDFYAYTRFATAPSNNYLVLIFFVNSTDITAGNGYYGPWGEGSGSGNPWAKFQISLVVGDYVELVGWTNSTTNFDLTNFSDSTYMSAQRIA